MVYPRPQIFFFAFVSEPLDFALYRTLQFFLRFASHTFCWHRLFCKFIFCHLHDIRDMLFGILLNISDLFCILLEITDLFCTLLEITDLFCILLKIADIFCILTEITDILHFPGNYGYFAFSAFCRSRRICQMDGGGPRFSVSVPS